jgi:hypothetical protein
MKKPETNDLLIGTATAILVLLVSLVVGKALDLLDLKTVLIGTAICVVIVLGIVGLFYIVEHMSHKEEIDSLVKRLKEIIPATVFPWLRSDAEMMEIESRVKCKEVWVVSPDLSHDTVRADIQRAVKKNIKRGITYTYILPKTEAINALLPALRNLFASSINQLKVKQIPENVFRSLTIRHMVIYNPCMDDDNAPQVFIELPVKGYGYWIEVYQDAGIALTGRIRTLIEEESV